ncbi:hypothetical protein [Psychrobium sp. 1_MG-2023]|uniref:hypothetical protein n=1 Tax=Psychrobium sp. 1_MG-2023 TaxID=3062624 RepID=UPI002736C129|nr:hypothetical protein [Psychrobium sp. 1_MG-2023]MDP2561280.1 hypothetical protein [Psychrobium sp. 1_MG-2023]
MNKKEKNYLVVVCIALLMVGVFAVSKFNDSVMNEEIAVKPQTATELSEKNITTKQETNHSTTIKEPSKPIDIVENINEVASEETRKVLSISEIYEQENVDYEWSSQREHNVRNLLDVFLYEESALIESLECKSTLCKLQISSDEASNFNVVIATTLHKIENAEWQKEGSVKLHRLRNDEGNFFTEIYISRYR